MNRFPRRDLRLCSVCVGKFHHALDQIESLLEEPLSIEVPAGTSEAVQKSIEVLKANYANSQEQLKLLVERMNACKSTCRSLSTTMMSR